MPGCRNDRRREEYLRLRQVPQVHRHGGQGRWNHALHDRVRGNQGLHWGDVLVVLQGLAGRRATHEWYKPEGVERATLSPDELDHVERGGLLLRKIKS